jgi:hypothetical protein
VSTCLECERDEQAEWHRDHGEDEAALACWESDVSSDRVECDRHPERSLEQSLLPLARKGHGLKACHHYLCGYDIVRDMTTTRRSSIAGLVEFCGLTGNEAHGLALVAEQSECWEPHPPDTSADFTAAVALLMRRLTELGHGERPVPGPSGAE